MCNLSCAIIINTQLFSLHKNWQSHKQIRIADLVIFLLQETRASG